MYQLEGMMFSTWFLLIIEESRGVNLSSDFNSPALFFNLTLQQTFNKHKFSTKKFQVNPFTYVYKQLLQNYTSACGTRRPRTFHVLSFRSLASLCIKENTKKQIRDFERHVTKAEVAQVLGIHCTTISKNNERNLRTFLYCLICLKRKSRN